MNLFEWKNNIWLFVAVLLACFAVSAGVRYQQFETWKLTPQAYFVGPRTALFNQYDQIAKRLEKGVDKVLHGLTGWAQVNGRDELPIPEKVVLDVEYMERQSFWFDLYILWLTVLKVVRRDGVSH